MFYLMTHSAHLIYSHLVEDLCATTSWKDLQTLEERKEGNVLFNDTLSTFCLQLSGRGPMCNYMEGYPNIGSDIGRKEGQKCFI